MGKDLGNPRSAFSDAVRHGPHQAAQKSQYFVNEGSVAALEHEIEIGRGGVWLSLTPEQYAKLKT